MLSGDAARPGKNAARVLLGSVCRKPVKEVWLQRDKNQDDVYRPCVGCVPSAVKCYCCTIYQLPMGKYLMV